MLLIRLTVIACCITLMRVAGACSPPPPAALVQGPAGTVLPQYNAGDYAFLGKVVDHGKDVEGNPALVVEVLDAWSARQAVGSRITVGVARWQGCSLPKPLGEPFAPALYPVGTRVRVVTPSLPMFTWDVGGALAVVGVAR